jgi:hypothetical protein
VSVFLRVQFKIIQIIFCENMKISRLRSVWGIAPGLNLDNWAQLFPELKKQGYSMLH